MSKQQTRRDFLKKTLVAGSAIPMVGTTLYSEDKKNPPPKNLTSTEREKIANQMMIRQMHERAALFTKLVKKYGKGVIDDVKNNTIEETQKRYQKAKLDKRNLEGITKYLWDGMKDGFEFQCVKKTDEKLAFKVTKCFIADVMRKLNVPELGFAFYCSWDYGFAKGLNPEIEFTRTKQIMLGDNHCNHTYFLKKKKG